MARYPFATPEQIANVVLFLASDESSAVKGHALVADGLFVLAACEFMRVLSSKGLRSALLSEQEHYDGVRGRSGAAPAGRGKPPPGWGGVVNRDDDDDDDDDEEVGGAETSGLKGLRGPTAASYSTVVPGGASATGW